MYFINSTFLFFLPLVIVPFIIHFLFFKKQKIEFFSSLFLIKRAYLKNRNLTRFKKYLIFLLRFLIVLLLVAAFAKPVIKTNKFISSAALGASGGESLKLLILIDRSYSMRYLSAGKTVYRASAGAALKILKSLGENDKAAVAFFSEEMETKHINWTDDFSSLENIIKASKPGFKGTDYIAVLEKAYECFSKENGGKKVILIVGDLSRHGFKNPSWKPKEIPSYNKDVTVLGAYFTKERRNGFIKNVFVDNKPEAQLAARVISGHDKNIPLEIILSEGSFNENRLFDGDKNGKSLIKFVLPEKKKSARNYERCGSISLKEDNLSVDNKFFYAFEKPDKAIKTLLLYSNPNQLKAGYSAYFLKKLLDKAPFINFKLSSAQRIEKEELKQYHLVICIGQKTASSLSDSLKSFVAKGGKLWLIPSSLNSDSRQTFPEDYGLKMESEKTGRYNLAANLKHEFFEKNNFKGYELNKIKIKKFLNFAFGNEEENILWRFNDGADEHPALIWKTYGSGMVAVFASSFDSSWSDMAFKPVFADFVFSFIKFFALEQGAKKKSMIYIGEGFKTTLNTPHMGKIKISGPRNKIYFEHAQNGNFVFNRAEIPGIYNWTDADGYDRCFAVNIDRRKGESRIIAANVPGIRRIGFEDPVADFNSAVYGAQLWRLFFLICVLLFIAEGVLSEKL